MFLASIKEVIPTPQTWVGAYHIGGNSDYRDGDNDNNVGDNNNAICDNNNAICDNNNAICDDDNTDADNQRDDDCSATSAQVLSTPNLG